MRSDQPSGSCILSGVYERSTHSYRSSNDIHVVIHLGNAAVPASKLEWSCMDEFSWKLDHYSLKPLTPPPHHTVEADEISYQDYSLVITGDVFRWMVNYAPLEILQRVGNSAHTVVIS